MNNKAKYVSTILGTTFLILAITLFRETILLKYILIALSMIFLSIGFFKFYTLKKAKINPDYAVEVKELPGKKEVTIDLAVANLYAMLSFLPVIFICVPPFAIIWWDRGFKEKILELLDSKGSSTFSGLLFYLGIILLGIIMHELLHGLVFAIYSKKGFRSIKFGIMWKMLTPYCHGKEALKVWQYRTGTILPGLLLGLVPLIISYITGNLRLLFFGIFFTITAMGDFLIIWMLRKYNPDQLVLDHPDKVGFFIQEHSGD